MLASQNIIPGPLWGIFVTLFLLPHSLFMKLSFTLSYLSRKNKYREKGKEQAQNKQDQTRITLLPQYVKL